MLQSLFTVLTISLPEGIEENQIYLEIEKFIKNLGSLENTMIDYLNLEITILTQVGYQIDLQTCAVTNKCEKLFYISPKSGRAVTQEAGHKYHDQLFIIPDYFYEHRPINYQEFLDGLKITGHFLQKNIFHHKNIAMPSSRVNLIDYVQKHTDI